MRTTPQLMMHDVHSSLVLSNAHAFYCLGIRVPKTPRLSWGLEFSLFYLTTQRRAKKAKIKKANNGLGKSCFSI
ncbi:hypothetical protein ACTAZI_09205 [Legionella bozemanae]